MFKLSSNAEAVFVRLQRNINVAEYDIEKNLRIGAADGLVLIANRIQQRGENAAGQRMHTKTGIGVYSKGYAKERSERGRQIDHVDFTADGDLFRSWNIISVSPRLVTAGFLSDKQADIAGYLEAYYGDAFYLSDTEQQQVIDGIGDRIAYDLTGQ